MEFSKEEIANLFEYKEGKLFRLTGPRKGQEAGWNEWRHNRFYRRVEINKKSFYAHRIIFFLLKGYSPKLIDHKNGDSLDNRIENLREATSLENSLNSVKRKNTSSRHKGITFVKNKFWARIKVNGKSINLGRFEKEKDALKARREAVKKHYNHFYKEK